MYTCHVIVWPVAVTVMVCGHHIIVYHVTVMDVVRGHHLLWGVSEQFLNSTSAQYTLCSAMLLKLHKN